MSGQTKDIIGIPEGRTGLGSISDLRITRTGDIIAVSSRGVTLLSHEDAVRVVAGDSSGNVFDMKFDLHTSQFTVQRSFSGQET